MAEQSFVIIDTDIGDDIDDALALAFALQCPEVNVLGIMTVFGNTEAKAKIAASLLHAAGCGHIPVHPGCGLPLSRMKEPMGSMDPMIPVHPMQPIEANVPNEPIEMPCQYIAEEMMDLPVSPIHAVDFIIDCVMNTDLPVTILAIGPLTNLAAALLKEPRLKDKLHKIVIMGGAYYFHYIEWNVYCDPEAANVVFQSGIPMMVIGLDVTKRCLMNEEQLNRLEKGTNSPVVQLLWRFIQQWQKDKNRTFPILHDALAVYGVFGGDMLHFEQETVSVELTGTYSRGLTFNHTDRDREEQLVRGARELAGNSVIQVANQVDSVAFIHFFLERVLSQPI